jgi:hypothetical protein
VRHGGAHGACSGVGHGPSNVAQRATCENDVVDNDRVATLNIAE